MKYLGRMFAFTALGLLATVATAGDDMKSSGDSMKQGTMMGDDQMGHGMKDKGMKDKGMSGHGMEKDDMAGDMGHGMKGDDMKHDGMDTHGMDNMKKEEMPMQDGAMDGQDSMK